MKNIIDESLAAVHTHTHTHTCSFNEIKNYKEEYKIKSYLSIKSNGGITLIALVITIIILIILAGISIMGITQTGIFDKTKLAKNKYEKSQKQENEILNEYESKINEYSIGSTTREIPKTNNYSKDEQAIGTWIDGKTVYSKTITGKTPESVGVNNNMFAMTSVCPNIDTIVNYYGQVYMKNPVWSVPLDFYAVGASIITQIDEGYFQMNCSWFASRDYFVTFEYTKKQ